MAAIKYVQMAIHKRAFLFISSPSPAYRVIKIMKKTGSKAGFTPGVYICHKDPLTPYFSGSICQISSEKGEVHIHTDFFSRSEIHELSREIHNKYA